MAARRHAPGAPLGWLARIQDQIAGALGVSSDDREARVALLLARSRASDAGYWLQLVVAMGIATLGLALNSTAVVIGAMLVSPLMGPIVELGMGLAVGSPLLVIRSFLRAGKSVALVVGLAALVTMALPFHEVTGEIAARVSPTALDLLVAVFCAIAAAYTQVRPGSDTTVTAAGTAIGIALVPPLCVVGYGAGTGSREIASGAALLFTANFCAIQLFAVLSFLLLGFERVSVRALEADEVAAGPGGLASRGAARIGDLFASRYGAAFRVAMPIALVAAVSLPLRRALDEVAWEVKVRSAVQQMLTKLPKRTVHTSLAIKQHKVSLHLIAVGSSDEAKRLQRELTAQIEIAAGVKPRVDVVGVAETQALPAAAEAEHLPLAPAAQDVESVRGAAREALAAAWPNEAAGALVSWKIALPNDGPPSVEVVHIGAALGGAGESLLAHTLENALSATPRIVDIAFPSAPRSAEAKGGEPWLHAALEGAAAVAEHDGVVACILAPAIVLESDDAGHDGSVAFAGSDAAFDGPSHAATETTILGRLRDTPAFIKGRLRIAGGTRWELTFTSGACRAERSDAGLVEPSTDAAPVAAQDAAAGD